MFPAARKGDPITHDLLVPSGVIGPPITGPCPSGQVIIEGLPAAHVTCTAVCTGVISAGIVHPPPGPPPPVISGSLNVLIHGKPAARWTPSGDMGACGSFLGDPKLTATRTVFIGGASSIPTSGFASRDEAARIALSVANPSSIRDNLEYGGMIYQNPDGTFGYTGPGRGAGAGFDPSSTPIPAGTTPAGDYHTHGDYSTIDPSTGNPVRTSDPSRDQYNSDNFSRTDRNGITSDARGNPGYTGYLGTPSGRFQKFDPATGTTSTL